MAWPGRAARGPPDGTMGGRARALDARRSLLSHVKGRARARVQPFDSHTIHTRAALAFMSAGHGRGMDTRAITFVTMALACSRSVPSAPDAEAPDVRVMASAAASTAPTPPSVAPTSSSAWRLRCPPGYLMARLLDGGVSADCGKICEVDADCNGRTCSRRGTLSGSGYLVTTALDGPPPMVCNRAR